MSEDLVYAAPANREQWEQLLFVLAQRSKPTIVIIRFDSYETRNTLHQKLIRELPLYNHHDMDLTSHTVVSLRRQFKEKLPTSVRNSKPVEYAVHVFGLENSILAPGTDSIEESGLISELNFEREALFHDNPFITIIWSDNYIFEKLRTEAGDLWDWITYKFKFTGDAREIPAASEPDPPSPLPQGHIPERKERIRNLIKKYERLKLNGPERERIVRERINIQKLLGQEYLELNRYEDAKDSFETALSLSNQIKFPQDIRMEIIFHLGGVFLKKRNFDTSLEKYKRSLQLQIEHNTNVNIGNTYHQIGMVFQKQQKWSKALTNYQTAIDWNKKTNNLFALGSTYHQIGRVFEKQQKWNEALINYQTAIDWKKKTNNLFRIGDTYHQIGMVFQKQQKWSEALTNYQTAIEWDQKNGNLFEIGFTYHQMGMVFQKQQEWNEAFTNYLDALSFNYTIEIKRNLTLDQIKGILPKLSQTKAKDLFEKHFPPTPPEKKDHCRKLIFEGNEDASISNNNE